LCAINAHHRSLAVSKVCAFHPQGVSRKNEAFVIPLVLLGLRRTLALALPLWHAGCSWVVSTCGTPIGIRKYSEETILWEKAQ
jgi:hypothetical protein